MTNPCLWENEKTDGNCWMEIATILKQFITKLQMYIQNGEWSLPLFYKVYMKFFFFFSGPHLWHMKVPKEAAKSELQLPGYTTGTEKQDLSCICNLPHNLWQRQILNPPSEARDQTHILLDTSQILNPLSHHNRNSWKLFLTIIKCHLLPWIL